MADFGAMMKVLGLALACGAALAATNWLTADRIRFNEQQTLRRAIATLLPAGAAPPVHIPAIDRNPGLWRLCSGHLLARSSVPGYAGPIQLLFTLDERDGQPPRLVRLTLLAHQETPGITDFLADPLWLSSFNDRTAGELAGLAAVSGATITSRALRQHLAGTTADATAALGPPESLDCTP